MARGRALKEFMKATTGAQASSSETSRLQKQMPKQSSKESFADDLGYFTKAKSLPRRLRGK